MFFLRCIRSSSLFFHRFLSTISGAQPSPLTAIALPWPIGCAHLSLSSKVSFRAPYLWAFRVSRFFHILLRESQYSLCSGWYLTVVVSNETAHCVHLTSHPVTNSAQFRSIRRLRWFLLFKNSQAQDNNLVAVPNPCVDRVMLCLKARLAMIIYIYIYNLNYYYLFIYYIILRANSTGYWSIS